MRNGQALCPTCNLSKGDRMKLRRWQEECFKKVEEAIEGQQRDFMVVAGPGSGKTWLALACARKALDLEVARRVVVVVPTEHLQRQWAEEAARFDIQLERALVPGGEREGFHGYAATYAAVSMNPLLIRTHTSKPTFVILDEIHHCGGHAAWSVALRQSFEGAIFRLSVSGTPFRSDNEPIPFITYEDLEDGTRASRADFIYSYRDALRDRDVVRPVNFHFPDGYLGWSVDGREMTATFEDALNQRDSRRRLRTAIKEDGWIEKAIADANEQLSRYRVNHPEAGGLIVCLDQARAREVAKLAEEITGDRVTVVTSTDEDGAIDPAASEKIKSFAVRRSRWLVCVKMVSEGVDIPRLRVLIYATTVTTKSFFVQAMGRIVRHIARLGDDQHASMYAPGDPLLRVYGDAFADDVNHVLKEAEGEYGPPERRDNGEDPPSIFMTHFAVGGEDIHAVSHGLNGSHTFNAEELARARAVQEKAGANVDSIVVAHILRIAEGVTKGNGATPFETPEQPAFKLREDLSTQLNRQVGFLARLSGRPHEHINADVKQYIGCPRERMSIKQLEQASRFIQQLIRNANSEAQP